MVTLCVKMEPLASTSEKTTFSGLLHKSRTVLVAESSASYNTLLLMSNDDKKKKKNNISD